MPDYPYISYQNPFQAPLPNTDTVALADTIRCDSVVPSFITSGFNGYITPLPRVTYDVLVGWNLLAIGIILLLVVLNKQLYPRQFRRILSVPGGVAHTNQLLREWTPTKSFLGVSFIMAYVVIIALFLQKSCVVFSRDVGQYNSIKVFGILLFAVGIWVLLRFSTLRLVNWLFEAKTKVKESDSITVKKEWFDKNNEERIAMHKQYSAVVISFGDGKNYYCVDEKTFTLMQEALSELEE